MSSSFVTDSDRFTEGERHWLTRHRGVVARRVAWGWYGFTDALQLPYNLTDTEPTLSFVLYLIYTEFSSSERFSKEFRVYNYGEKLAQKELS